MNIKLALIDSDYVVRAKADLAHNGQNDPFRDFIQQVKEELVTGQTAYLEIEDANKDPVKFEITQAS